LRLPNSHHSVVSPLARQRYSVHPHRLRPPDSFNAMSSRTKADPATTAKLLVVLLAFAWGLNWIAAAIALRELSPWSLRVAGSGIGAATLFAAAVLSGHNLKVPRGEYIHIMIAGLFNVAGFQILSSFAQLSGATTRAIIITYSMPIWTTVLSCLVLGERLNAIRWFAFGLCVVGLTVLLWPLFAHGFPPFVFYSLGCALSWTFATVYIKWAKVTVEPLANAAWQLLFGLVFITAGSFLFEGHPHLWPMTNETILAVLFVGLFGVGLAHFLWWSIVDRLPAVTASLGSLLVPVIGVSASAIVLDERLTVPDIVGFAMIFAAAACVLLQPNVRHDEMPE
jgi:drug/metabolite transporter (DMT)-like permease